MQLSEFADHYPSFCLQLSPGSAEQYAISARNMDRWHGRPLALDDLTDELVRRFLAARLEQGLAPATVNRDRGNILTLWRMAWRKRLVAEQPRDVPRIKMPRRNPTAWSPEEIGRIIKACASARQLDGWDQRTWIALVLTAYDSLERLDALLSTAYSDLDADNCTLLIRACHRKGQTTDMVHRLHQTTVAAIERSRKIRYRKIGTRRGPVPVGPRARALLFPWPLRMRAIWLEYGAILKAAGLPHTRRDKFHRVRRSGYTGVYAAAGVHAATLAAGHARDLSSVYLDRTKLPAVDTASLLPRPKAS